MRQGIPIAGNHLMTELAIVTGAVEAVVVDYQCIMPGLVQVSACYHTKFITTSEKARFTGAVHYEVKPHNAREQAGHRPAGDRISRSATSRASDPGEPWIS
jgi:carbon-monoxide dehydrogenase catalytic subunit